MQQTQQPHLDDEIDLRELVGVMIWQRFLIGVIAAAGVVLGALVSFMSTEYVSEGLFLTPEVSVNNYKRYESAFSSAARLQQFLNAAGQSETVEGRLLLDLSQEAGAIRTAVTPEFAFTDKDQKVFGVKVAGDEFGAMIGVRLRYEHPQPARGTPVVLLSEYLRDTFIRVDMESIMLEKCSVFRAREQELRNAQISNNFVIAQEEKRVETLREIIARSPAASTLDNRQIVSLEKGSERFLSATAQLVAAEIYIADLKLNEMQNKRERVANAIKRDYYCQAQQMLQKQAVGRAFLDELKRVQVAAFENHDRSFDIIEKTWNELDVEREEWANVYLQRMRFVASPEGDEVKRRKPGLALGIVLGGMLGGMLGVMAALARAWWRGGFDVSSVNAKG